MKVAVNIQPVLHTNKSGIGFYESEMLKALLSNQNKDEYIFNYFDIKKNKRAIVDGYLTEKVSVDCCEWFSATLYQMIWSVVPLPYRLFFKEKPDISVFFNYHLPPFARGKKVLVVYDTVVKDHPETVRFKTKVMLKLTLRRSIKRADRIITISQFSKNQIMKHYGVDESIITVIPCAADTQKYYPMQNAAGKIEDVKKKYGIRGSFFLYLGNLEPRKNIVRLIEAYNIARKKIADIPKLVLAGGKGWLYDDIFAKVTELELQDSVVFPGYIEDEDVPFLMNGAAAFCFPSLYEGFGMPPLEAMACGTPVIVSNSTSLPEVVGDTGIKVDPYSVGDISEAIIKICDNEFAADQGRKALERSKCFSWVKSAEKLHTVFEELLNEKT